MRKKRGTSGDLKHYLGHPSLLSDQSSKGVYLVSEVSGYEHVLASSTDMMIAALISTCNLDSYVSYVDSAVPPQAL